MLQPLSKTMAALAPGAVYLLLAAGIAAAVAFVMPDEVVTWAMFSVAGTLVITAGWLRLALAQERRRRARQQETIANFVAHDAAPSFTTDPEGEIGYQNRAALDRFGSRGGQGLARTLAELFADPGAVLRRLQSKAEAKGAAREDLVTRRGHLRLSVHRIGSGDFLWRLEDMAERAIGGRGAETISLPMLTVSKGGTILFMNEALRRLVGERVRSLDRIFTDLPLRSGEEHEIKGQDGPVTAVVAQLQGAGGRSEVYLLPIPGPRAAEEGANFEALPVAMLRLSAHGRVRAANRAARGLLGRIEPQSRLSDLLEGLGRPVSDWVNDALAGRADGRPEVLRARRGDKEVFLQVTLSRIVENGRAGLLAVLSDATQLKTLEAQFVQSQKMQAIGQLAGGVAHDFNNLLTAISGHCDLLMLRHDKGDGDYADLDQISQNANRAAALVGQLLAFSRKQTLKPETLDLRDTLSDLTHLLNRLVGEKVALSVRHECDAGRVRADKRQLEQVIMNLVVNARDAMPGGGEIRIETEAFHLAENRPRDRVTVPKGDYVAIKVTDTGSGIPADKLGKIFEPFFTTKRTGEGTGLGLSTAYGIVKQTGGYIFCDSVIGTGTSFTILLPAYDLAEEAEVSQSAEPAPELEPATKAPVPPRAAASTIAPKVEIAQTSVPDSHVIAGDATVLLVEDEPPVRAFASRALQLRGYTVLEAESAEEALELLEDSELKVDIFVTDVIMPGLDGPSWVRQALEARPGTRTVFMSGYAEEVFQNGSSPVPDSVFLPKPFSLGELTATVQELLSR
ncbi:hybrid sensor histidine kinase/response regulator [Thioclava sp. JM3]|uniref:ATP-binding protein n=1 Tax=Thioclava sp. JM3 TaxID=1973004 RepID=UPI000B54068B|nr:ATP-binding protein [Thioclava sp. JM3]OWY18377.1 hybrid sensor histidine kinase/response regulator [Thioclava sp. JM3]